MGFWNQGISGVKYLWSQGIFQSSIFRSLNDASSLRNLHGTQEFSNKSAKKCVRQRLYMIT